MHPTLLCSPSKWQNASLAYVMDLGFVCGLMLLLCGVAEVYEGEFGLGRMVRCLGLPVPSLLVLSQRAGATPGKAYPQPFASVSLVDGRPPQLYSSAASSRYVHRRSAFACLRLSEGLETARCGPMAYRLWFPSAGRSAYLFADAAASLRTPYQRSFQLLTEPARKSVVA